MLIILVLLALMFACTKSEAQLAFGIKTSNDPGLIIHDFTESNLMKPDMFGLERYGFGRGQLEITERPQIMAENRGGVLIGSGVARIGIEPGAGMIAYQNRPVYQWEPAMSAGLKLDLGLLAIYAAPRAGLSYTKDTNDIISGGVVGAQLAGINVSYWRNDYYNTKDSLDIVDVTLDKKYNVQRQVRTGKEDLYYVGMKVEM